MTERPGVLGLPTAGIREIVAAVRSLRKAPGFAIPAVAALAFSSAAITLVFAVADGVLLRSLPYREPERLAMLRSMDLTRGSPVLAVPTLTVAAVSEGHRGIVSLAFLGGHRDAQESNSLGELVRVREASENLLETLGVVPERGRLHQVGDASYRELKPAVIGHAYWLHRFGGDPAILGRVISFDTEAVQIVGVLPRSFLLPSPGDRRFDVLLPIPPLAPASLEPTGSLIAPIVRLRDDRFESHRSELDVLQATTAGRYPDTASTPVRMIPLQAGLFEARRPALSFLFLCAAMLLLLACINVAYLFAARGADRAAEVAVRLALGASQRRLFAMLAAEACVVALVAGLFAVGLAAVALSAASSLAPPDLRTLVPTRLDIRAVIFSLLTVVPSAVVAVGIPSARLLQSGPAAGLKQASHRSQIGWSPRGAHGVLTIQVALAFVLLISGASLAHRFATLAMDDVGLDSRNLAAVSMTVPTLANESDRARFQNQRDLMTQLADHPSVLGVAAADALPMVGARPWMNLLGKRGSGGARFRVTSNFFEVMGATFVDGRSFQDHGQEHTPSAAVVVNQSAAALFWPGERALGKHLDLADEGRQTVVGVVRDMKARSGAASEPTLYMPLREHGFQAMTIVARMIPGRSLQRATLLTYAKRLNPRAAVRVWQVNEMMNDAVSQDRFAAVLSGSFGLIALLVTFVGVYGVQARVAAWQTRSMSVRLALGCSPGALQRSFMRNALAPVGAGLLIGAAASWSLVRMFGATVPGIGSVHPETVAAAVTTLVVASVAAALVPARRIAQLDPNAALRTE